MVLLFLFHAVVEGKPLFEYTTKEEKEEAETAVVEGKPLFEYTKCMMWAVPYCAVVEGKPLFEYTSSISDVNSPMLWLKGNRYLSTLRQLHPIF